MKKRLMLVILVLISFSTITFSLINPTLIGSTVIGNNAEVEFTVSKNSIIEKCIDFQMKNKKSVQPIFETIFESSNFNNVENLRIYSINKITEQVNTPTYVECKKIVKLYDNLTESYKDTEINALCTDKINTETIIKEILNPIEFKKKIDIQKDEIKNYRICFDTPIGINKLIGGGYGWGSRGILVLDIDSEKYMDTSHSSWWNVSWGYRQRVNITDNFGFNMTQYSMNLSINTSQLIGQGKLNVNCSDLRLVENGSSGIYSEVSFGIINCNTSNTSIVYKVLDGINFSTDSDTFIYYGNPVATSTNISWSDAYYLWNDDFNTNRGWSNSSCPGASTTADTDQLVVSGGELFAAHVAYNDMYVCPTDGSWNNMIDLDAVIFEWNLKVQNDNACQVGIPINNGSSIFQSPNLRPGQNDYNLGFSDVVAQSLSSGVYYAGYSYWNKLNGTWFGRLDSSLPIQSGTLYPASKQGRNFTQIKIDICNNINMYLDYFRVYGYIEPKPTYKIGAEETYLDTSTPSYTNFQNNASTVTKINGVVNWSVTLSDNIGLNGYKFAHNNSGTLTNDSFSLLSGTSAFVNTTITIIKPQGNYICGQYWFNDTSNNVNQTSLSCFTVANSIPTTPIVYYPVNGNNYTSIPYINYSSSDVDNDTITYKIYINSTLNISTTVNVTQWNASDGYYAMNVSATDGINSSSNSSTIYFRLDTTAPSFSNNQTNATSTTPKYNDVVQLNLTISDNGVGLSGYRLAHNDTGTFVNGSYNAVSGSSYKTIENITIANLKGGGVLGWKIQANDTLNNINISSIYTLTIKNTNITLKTDLAFINWSAGHKFNATSTFTDLDNSSDVAYSNISFTSGDCDYHSNSTSGNDITIKYNCSGTALTSTIIQLNATDLGGAVANSSFKTNVFPNNVPTMTGTQLNKTLGVIDTDDLNCSAVGKSDIDTEDTTTYRYEWYNNSIAKGIDNVKLLSTNLTGLGIWYCEAWATDSYQNSSKYTSSSVSVNFSTVSPSIVTLNATTETTGINSTSINPTNNNSWINISIQFSDANNDRWTAYFCTTPTWSDCQNNISSSILCKSENNVSNLVLSCVYNVSGYTGTNPRTFYGYVLDNTSLQSDSKSATFEVSYPPPQASLVYPPSNTYTNLNYTLINWSATDPDGDTINYTLYINSSSNFELIYNGTNTSFNYLGLTEYTTYWWRIFTIDQHGYGLYNATLGNFTADFTNPNMTVSSPTATTYNSETVSLTINAKDFAINACNYTIYYKDTFTIKVSGTANCQGSATLSTPYYSGGYSLYAYAYDMAGNSNLTIINFTTQSAATPGGGGSSTTTTTTTIIEAPQPKVAEIKDLCGNGICEESASETPWNCARDCSKKLFELNQIFCRPMFECGNWKTAWFNNFMIITVLAGLGIFAYRAKKVGRLQ